MTLTEIAQTFPPMWAWNRQQEQTVAKAIRAIVGQTFICNHPNMKGVETTVVEQHPHSRGTTLFLHSPSRADQSVVNHECDIFHFVEFYTPKTQDDPMPIHMTHKEFLNAFANEGQALYYIDNILAEGRIEVSENQVPYVDVKVNPDTDEYSAVERADIAPVLHSFEMRIARWYEDDDSSADAIVRFECDEGVQWFLSNLWSDLQWDAESRDLYWDDYKTRMLAALVIKRSLTQKRLNRAKSRVGETPSHSPQFIAACREVVECSDCLKRIGFALEGY